jgi:hypothetical protein
MPLDFVVGWFLQPVGLVALASAVLLGVGAWALALGTARYQAGLRPIGMGYIAGIAGPVLLLFAVKVYDFSVGEDAASIKDREFWPIVLYQVLYMSVLALFVLLPAYILLAVVAGLLVRHRGTIPGNVIALLCFMTVLVVSTVIWWSSSGHWLFRDHLALFLKSFAATVVLVGFTEAPFLFAVQMAVARRQPSEA